MRKILVMRGGALGDFILTIPVLAALRRHFPKCKLEILGYPPVASLAVVAGLADDVLPLESPRFTGFFAPDGPLSADVAEWFGGFDCIISYLYDPEQIFQRNAARCSAARFIAGPHRPDETLALHAVEQLLRPLQALDIRDSDARPRLILPGAPPASACFALHPGSGSERKNWPESSWAGLLKVLTEQTACNFLLVGGEAEGSRCARLAATVPAGRARVAQNLPLTDLARQMRACCAFIGHDSGITHLAAALDMPGLALWGESNLAVWRPRSPRLIVLSDPAGLQALPVAVVWQKLKEFL